MVPKHLVEELAEEYAGRVTIAKVNVDEHPTLAARFWVQSIPTLRFFKGGQVIGQMVGALPKGPHQEAPRRDSPA